MKSGTETTNIKNRNIEDVATSLNLFQTSEDLLVFDMPLPHITNLLHQPFRTNGYTLLLLKHGEVHVRVNMFNYKLKQNDLLIISPSAIREYLYAQPNSEIQALLFTKKYVFNLSLKESFVDTFNMLLSRTHFHLRTQSHVFEDFRALTFLINKQLNEHRVNDICDLLLLSILTMIFKISKGGTLLIPKETNRRQSNLVMHFFQLLPPNIRRTREVSDYATMLEVNPRYLSKVLVQKTGKSASVLITEMVILEAKVLLSKPETAIRQAALELGFPDQFVFSKYFKKHTGINPSQYRPK